MSARIKNRQREQIQTLPEIGRLHVGVRKENGLPMSVDYFVPAGKYAELFNAAFPEHPSNIPVIFPEDNDEIYCNEYYELRDKAGKLVSDGDGETFRVWHEKVRAYESYTVSEHPALMQSLEQKYQSKWRVKLTLRFIIPQVRGVMGLWAFSTSADASSIPSIIGSYEQVRKMNGTVAGVIFDLSVKMHVSNKPGDSSRYPVVNLVVNESKENVERVMAMRKSPRLEIEEQKVLQIENK